MIELTPTSLPPSGRHLLLAVPASLALNLALAHVYRATYRGNKYSQDYAQTLILIGVVTTVLISVVNGNAPIAFGMFAAFSVVRFRRSLGQSRDLAFVLIVMAVGMVVGAGLYWSAVFFATCVSAVVYGLARLDAFGAGRSSHCVALRVPGHLDFETLIEPVLARHAESAVLLSASSSQAGLSTELRYSVQLRPGAAKSALLEDLLQVTGNDRVVLQATADEPVSI